VRAKFLFFVWGWCLIGDDGCDTVLIHLSFHANAILPLMSFLPPPLLSQCTRGSPGPGGLSVVNHLRSSSSCCLPFPSLLGTFVEHFFLILFLMFCHFNLPHLQVANVSILRPFNHFVTQIPHGPSSILGVKFTVDGDRAPLCGFEPRSAVQDFAVHSPSNLEALD